MASIYQRRNKDGTKVWRAVVRIKGYPTVCDHFSRKQEAQDWANEVERQIKLGKYNYGWDNRTFRLGKQMSIRLPSAERYVAKVPIEHKWLPKLASKPSIPIPKPIAIGKPNKNYPWNWSIYGWIEGQRANTLHIDDKILEKFATQLADFLNEFQAIDSSDGPLPGEHNFFSRSFPNSLRCRNTIDN